MVWIVVVVRSGLIWLVKGGHILLTAGIYNLFNWYYEAIISVVPLFMFFLHLTAKRATLIRKEDKVSHRQYLYEDLTLHRGRTR